MILAKKGPDSDIHLVVSNNRMTFFCIHTDRTRLRLWEPAIQMNVNEAHHHVKMHIQLGHKVPEGILDLIQVQYLRQD
jgi:hypothetical protein